MPLERTPPRNRTSRQANACNTSLQLGQKSRDYGKLKATDQLRWVVEMNNAKSTTEEIVFKEIITHGLLYFDSSSILYLQSYLSFEFTEAKQLSASAS
ncbi:MAG: TnpV protein [Parabacteroides sp.]|nr:TnpV protein [Parabacteroides sp.]